MISFDIKQELSSPSTLNSSTSEEKPELSFSDLLRGVVNKKNDKTVQNGLLVLDLSDTQSENITPNKKPSSTKNEFLSLLKSDDNLSNDSDEPVQLNQKITATLTPRELKDLVIDAKEYLKSKIMQSEEFLKSDIKELPKTLKGLVELAKKFDIDVSKITIQEVQTVTKKVQTVTKEFQTATKDIKLQNTQSTQQTLSEMQKSDKPQETKIQEAKPLEVILKSSQKGTKAAQNSEDIAPKIMPENRAVVKNTPEAAPLLKAQTTAEPSTAQIVQTKLTGVFKIEEKTPKEKVDETLQLLLRGEKAVKASTGMTADFSVATARVIASNSATEAVKSLESLLHSDTSESNSNSSKVDGLTAHKADSFEVKLAEAKQMIKYLSNDVKTAIEDYKSPFTRVKVQLNPQRLGEVDVTIIQRGKNLHVNLSSNNTAINTLAMNANELRAQLTNSGINNASLNFNNSSQNSEQNASQQQQNNQQQKEAHEEYGILQQFDNEEANEEILSSLEIVVPNYA